MLGAKVLDSVIADEAVIKGNCQITNCTIKEFAVVEGDAVLNNVTLSARMRIGYGIWESAPRYFEVSSNELIVGITESINGYCYVGCQHKPIKDWLKKHTLFSRVAGWSDSMTKTAVRNLTDWLG